MKKVAVIQRSNMSMKNSCGMIHFDGCIVVYVKPNGRIEHDDGADAGNRIVVICLPDVAAKTKEPSSATERLSANAL